ncbi:hypothetical protein JOB18_009625 [Solea senegalensis]|uniref:Uncharacterized protein n=1 Tax=Solea senegalensis TaxID=28829 RepID=A0AAV6Q2S6_SOLSE|nr:hypothetical protein JOB18_009625 [Solea senegalensis]
MQETKQMENSLPYLKWQLDQVKYQYEYSTEVWGDRVSAQVKTIKSKDEKIKTLLKEVTELKSSEEGLSEKLNESKQEIQRLVRKVAAWERNVLRQMEDNKGFKQELDDTRVQNKAMLTENEKLKHLVESLEVDVDKWKIEVSKTHKSYIDIKTKRETEVSYVKEENTMLKEAIKKTEILNKNLQQEMLKKQKSVQKDKGVCTTLVEKNLSLQKNIEDQVKMIKSIKKDYNKLSEQYLSVVEKNTTFQNKSKENVHLKQTVRNLQDQVRSKTENMNILRVQIKELQNKVARLENDKQNECKINKVNAEFKGKNLKLTRDVESLNTRLRVSEQHRSKQKDEIRKQEMQIRRFVSDVESCMVVIEDPRKLRSTVMKLKTNCADNRKKVQPSDNENTSLKKVHHNEGILQSTRECVEQRLENQALQFNREMSNLNRKVNEQNEEIADLKIRLQNATKPTHISNEIRNTVIQNPRNYPAEAQKTMHTCKSDATSSSKQPTHEEYWELYRDNDFLRGVNHNLLQENNYIKENERLKHEICDLKKAIQSITKSKDLNSAIDEAISSKQPTKEFWDRDNDFLRGISQNILQDKSEYIKENERLRHEFSHLKEATQSFNKPRSVSTVIDDTPSTKYGSQKYYELYKKYKSLCSINQNLLQEKNNYINLEEKKTLENERLKHEIAILKEAIQSFKGATCKICKTRISI